MAVSDWYQRQFGDRSTFAMTIALGEDPHPRGDELATSTWGELSLWVRGRCLTQSVSEGSVQEGVRWPLFSILQWFVEVAHRLVNEDPWPRFSRGIDVADGVGWFDATLHAHVIDPEEEQRWFERRSEWRHFHALRRAAIDVALPNVVFKRQGTMVEISWDNEAWASPRPGLSFTAQRGCEFVDARRFAEVLQEALREVTTSLAERPGSALQALAELRRTAAGLQAGEDDWRWLIHRKTAELILTSSGLTSLRDELRAHTKAAASGVFVPHSQATLLLRLARLESEAEIDSVLGLRAMVPKSPASPLLQGLIHAGDALTHRPWEEGNDYAEHVREKLGWGDAPIPDLAQWLRAQGVAVRDDDMGVPAFVSLVSERTEDRRSAIHINPAGASRHRKETGVATAFGHVLLDREPFSMDGEWEHWPSAARARAFGVALMLPESGVKKTLAGKRAIGPGEVRELMNHYRVGPLAATFRLRNLALISGEQQQELAALLAAA